MQLIGAAGTMPDGQAPVICIGFPFQPSRRHYSKKATGNEDQNRLPNLTEFSFCGEGVVRDRGTENHVLSFRTYAKEQQQTSK
jgi:hypothetical protein